MRHATPAGVLLVLLAASSSPVHAGPERQLVVALAPAPPGAAAAPATTLATRLPRLGLALRRTLAYALPAGPAAGALPGAAGPVEPFALDPARVWLLEAADSLGAAAALDSLARDPAVEWVEPNRPRQATAVSLDDTFPDDPLFRIGRQWALENRGPASPFGGVAGADIQARAAWATTTGSNDLRLAIADTGIDPGHPDLEATMPDGSPRILLGVDVSGEDPETAYRDRYGHGTFVAGVMAARTNDGAHFDSLGIAGVCGGDGRANLGCHIVPIKISPGASGFATSWAVAEAALYATAVGARAMNLSFAGDAASRVERLAFGWALTHGCVVVAAAGNHGGIQGDLPQYPAAYSVDGVCIQVGGSDEYDRRAGFSSYGPGLELVAPGLDIWSTFLTYPSDAGAFYPGYAPWAGTSFSAPCVTGTVGLLASVRPELTDTDFARVVRESAHDIGAPGVDPQTGWGRLDAAAALDAVRPAMGIWHDEVAGRTFRSLGFDTLDVGEGGFGSMSHWTGRHLAELLEVTATVALPDSFLGPVRVWPRVGGTTTVRGGFSLPYFTPWADVVEWMLPGSSLPAGARSFTLRGYLYRLTAADCAGCGDADVPLPADQMRFGFTVLGPVDRPPRLALVTPAAGDTLSPGQALDVRWSASDPDRITGFDVDLVQDGRAPLALARLPGDATGATVDIPCAAWPGPARLRVTARDEAVGPPERTSADLALRIRLTDCNGGPGARLALSPNPSDGTARIRGPAGTRVAIYDLAGRRVREAVLDAGGAWAWDGRDDAGRELGPGIYFARAGASTRLAKLVRVR